MKLVRCSQHHFYDADKYEDCPYCTGKSLNAPDSIITIDRGVIYNSKNAEDDKTELLDETELLDTTELLDDTELIDNKNNPS